MNKITENLPLTTKSFTHDGKSKKFIAEFSSIKAYYLGTHNIILISHVTGQKSEWELIDKRYNGDEFLYFLFVPTKKTIQNIPQLSGYTMTIFND